MASKGFETDKKVLLRRLVALPLVVLLAFLPAVHVVHATDPVTAATLAVTGGQLAAGGIAGEAGAAALAGPVGAVVGITLAALGVNAYVSSAAQAAGKSRTRFVLDKLVIWGAQAGYTQEQLYSKIAQGISVAADGTIQLGKDAANIISQFGNWITSQNDEFVSPDALVSSGTTVNIGNTLYNVGAITIDYDSVGVTHRDLSFNNSNDVGMCCCNDSGSLWYVAFSVLPNQYSHFTGYSGWYGSYGNMKLTNYRNGYYFMTACPTLDVRNYNLPRNLSVYNGSMVSFIDSLPPASSITWNPEASQSYDEVFTGTPEDWAENKDVLNPAGDTPITLNPDLINPIIDSLADGKQATMSIIDYLQALQEAWDHALDDVQTAIGTITDTLTGIQESIAVPDAATKNPTVTNPSVTPDTTPVLDPSEVDTGTVITGFQFDLTEIFPFCLPFDVYKMLRLLDAEPVAPSHRFQFDVPIPGLPGHSVGSWHFDYTIDLAQFNAVAALLRKLELLSFCIGLAYVTRSMFIRS